uniref:mas-related G-protein coupled receptor member A6-like isoform X2 n=1 Tax=Scatophagus argus TaxID=75038 RepID=UPI001ED7D2EA|nr:mas-related G-protein coupled receptor member A6-like isoform X2 [Scatophagus argus]
MEGFSNISTSQDKSYNYSNTTSDCPVRDGVLLITYVMTCVIICIGLPLTLMAICAVFSLVRNNHVAPIYVINLLISDLIQFCCLITKVAACEDQKIATMVALAHDFGLVASVCFMVCIALERYLVIACPLWYRFKRPIKTSVVVCVLVWVLTLVYVITFTFYIDSEVSQTIFAASLLVPLPLFFCFLGGTLKALSASRVPSDDKRQIVGILVLVLLIYILLFLPTIIWFLGARNNLAFTILSTVFIRLSPLADLTLYVFMRRGTMDKLSASVCHCTMDSNDISS